MARSAKYLIAAFDFSRKGPRFRRTRPLYFSATMIAKRDKVRDPCET